MKPLRGWLCVLFVLTLLLSSGSVARVGDPPRSTPATPVIAILGAMSVEVETLGQELTQKRERSVQGARFTGAYSWGTGRLGC
jgi:hypothetical protein